MKKSNFIIAIMFCLYIGTFFVLNIVLPDTEYSPIENRYLAKPPTFSIENLLSGDFSAKYETYITDQFPFRDNFVATKSTTERLLGKSENNDVYISSENTLIQKFQNPNYEKIDRNIESIIKFEQTVPIPVSTMIIPMQNDIYSYKLPENAPTYSEKEVIDHVYESVFNPVFVYDKMMEHNDEYIYYDTDHHWTSLGAYYAYEELMKHFGKEIYPLGEKNTLTTDFNGTVFSKSGVRYSKADTIDIYRENMQVEIEDDKGISEISMFNFDKLEENAKYNVFFGGDHPIVRINGTGEGKLLIIKDSYSNTLVPFLTENFEEIHMIDIRYMRLPASQYVEEYGIDNVLIAFSVSSFESEDNFYYLR